MRSQAYPKGAKGAGRVYQGARETKDMVDYATSMVPGAKVEKIKKTHEIDAWLAQVSVLLDTNGILADGFGSTRNNLMFCSFIHRVIPCR